jgi:hypothetical protein
MAKDIAPSEYGVGITTSDANQISAPRALYVGTAGNLVVRFKDSTADVTFKNVSGGQILPISPVLVKLASTAADIVALY